MDNLTQEIQTAQKHSARLHDETARATARQVEERQRALQKVEDDYRQRLEPLKVQVGNAKRLVAGLEQTKIELETDLTGLETLVTARRGMVEALDTRLIEVERAIVDANDKKTAVEAQITALQEQISPLQVDLAKVQSEIDELMVVRDKFKGELGDITTALDVKQAEMTRLVVVATAQHDTLVADSQQLTHEMELERTELARRIKATEDREKVVTQREAKAKRDEAVNLRNSQLMSL